MATNDGILLLAALGALLFLGKPKKREKEPSELVAVTSTSSEIVGKDGTPVIISNTAEVEIGGVGGDKASYTELSVRRQEQIDKQMFSYAANSIPSPTIVTPLAIAPDPGGDSPRPTGTAIPVWSNRVGYYWVDPQTGLPVGPGGVVFPAVNKESAGVNIGRDLPAGWVARGGSARYAGVVGAQTDF